MRGREETDFFEGGMRLGLGGEVLGENGVHVSAYGPFSFGSCNVDDI